MQFTAFPGGMGWCLPDALIMSGVLTVNHEAAMGYPTGTDNVKAHLYAKDFPFRTGDVLR